MIQKCPVCGESADEAFSATRVCPNCGSDLQGEASIGQVERPGVLRLPPRNSLSVEDGLKEDKRETCEMGGGGEGIVFFSWHGIFAQRPFDRPFYSAMKGRACILIKFSSGSVAREQTIKEVLKSAYPCAVQVEPFLGGGYPVVRCNFVFPDSPHDPYVLDSPLDICDGNAQDFFQSAVADENVDLILGHERISQGEYAASCHAEGLASAVSDAVDRAMQCFRPWATKADFESSVRKMESVYPNAFDGLNPQRMIKLVVTGGAKTGVVEY
jgi:hypothetical protein